MVVLQCDHHLAMTCGPVMRQEYVMVYGHRHVMARDLNEVCGHRRVMPCDPVMMHDPGVRPLPCHSA